MTDPRNGDAFLVVTRDEGLIAGECAASLYVDGTHVADLRNSEQVRVFVKVGKHLVGVRANKGCFGGSDQVDVEVAQDQPTLLRIEVALPDGWKIRPSAF